MSKDIDKLRQIVNKSEDYDAFCELIKTVPLFRNNAKDLFVYDKNTKEKICKLIKEIALKCIDLTEISYNYLEKEVKEIHKKPNVKSYTIETYNMQDALKQLEELDLPEEVKELVRKSLKE